MKTQLLPGEILIKDSPANLQCGFETVGGRIHLTSERLVFEAHAINIQTGTTIIPLESISDVRKCWTRFLNVRNIALLYLLGNPGSILFKAISCEGLQDQVPLVEVQQELIS